MSPSAESAAAPSAARPAVRRPAGEIMPRIAGTSAPAVVSSTPSTVMHGPAEAASAAIFMAAVCPPLPRALNPCTTPVSFCTVLRPTSSNVPARRIFVVPSAESSSVRSPFRLSSIFDAVFTAVPPE